MIIDRPGRTPVRASLRSRPWLAGARAAGLFLLLLLVAGCAGRPKPGGEGDVTGPNPFCEKPKEEPTDQDKAAALSYVQLATSYYEGEDANMAMRTLKEAECHNAREPQIKFLFGIIFLGKRWLDKAEIVFKQAIELDPKMTDAYVGLATVYMERKEWSKAIEVLQMPSKDLLYRRKDIVFDNLGWCHHMIGEDQKAIEYLTMAVSENPNNCHAWYNMGLVYKSREQYRDAAQVFDNCVRQCPNFFYGHYELGVAAVRSGDTERARPALQKCVEMGAPKGAPEAAECRTLLENLP